VTELRLQQERTLGADIHLELEKTAPATNNNAALTEFVRETARSLGLNVVDSKPAMTGEDFAVYQQKIPGVFLQFGAASPFGLHHPKFAANPACIFHASELLCEIAKRTLTQWKNHEVEEVPQR
jgi:metal-dependent amidase/aminoacylase/carboxypeptidase family protein